MARNRRDHIRLSDYLVRRGDAADRKAAEALVIAGLVYVDGMKAAAAGGAVTGDEEITVRQRRRFVSRGGEKLDRVLDIVGFNVSGLDCLDAGASTGGFTDCLLKRGARLVYAVDVARGKLDWTLRQDPRVMNLEQTNIRDIGPVLSGKKVDITVIDISFSSLRGIIPGVQGYVRPSGHIMALIKPQFELPAAKLKKGIVQKACDREAAVKAVLACGEACRLRYISHVPSPVKGARGNQEYFALWQKYEK